MMEDVTIQETTLATDIMILKFDLSIKYIFYQMYPSPPSKRIKKSFFADYFPTVLSSFIIGPRSSLKPLYSFFTTRHTFFWRNKFDFTLSLVS